MSDVERIRSCIDEIETALARIDRRFQGIESPDDFIVSDEGLDKLDGIAMMLVWMGESLKKMDRLGAGSYLEAHPEVNWKGAKGMRDILSHDYNRVDSEAVYEVCREHLGGVRTAIRAIREELVSREKSDDARKG